MRLEDYTKVRQKMKLSLTETEFSQYVKGQDLTTILIFTGLKRTVKE